MALPPAFDNGLERRRYFAITRRLLEQASKLRYEIAVLDTLSMGMTASFEAAILKGVIVRIGTGIYGPRE